MRVSGTVIAIDGPAGAGKSTLARRLATELDLPYINTGLMYRALALRALLHGVAQDDADALGELAAAIGFELDERARPPELLIDGRAPGPELISPEVESSVSQVSAHPSVRMVFRGEQRRLAAGGAVMEGRDIGTVVAPDASLKLYLVAHPIQRAGRRADERDEETEAVAESLDERDTQDAQTNPF
ncbi:MAG: (d)CMP kinase, partial [Actinomycetota bacterium]